MNNRLMWWYIDTAVLLSTCKSKHVVIFIDSTANCTE